jgi:hypothetical protein
MALVTFARVALERVARQGFSCRWLAAARHIAWKVLLVRGTVALDVVDGIPPEYEAMSRRVMGDEGAAAWLSRLELIAPQMLRIRITPSWVGVLDFESRFLHTIERGIELLTRAQAE